MALDNSTRDAQLANLMYELGRQRSLYTNAVLRDHILAIKKEIRLKIKELEVKVNELNRINRDNFN